MLANVAWLLYECSVQLEGHQTVNRIDMFVHDEKGKILFVMERIRFVHAIINPPTH